MVRKRPVKIWVIKHRPNKDPKFQNKEILAGIGISTKALFIILKRGCCLRMAISINLTDVKEKKHFL